MGRWTDIAEWVGPIPNSGDGDGVELEPEDSMGRVMGLVVHTAEGTYQGTIAWQYNPVSEVGSHFINAKDGRRAQMIDTHDRSWCQSAGNTYWLSSENEGFGSHGEPLTAEQIESNAQEFARIVRENPHVPLQVSNSPNTPGLGWHGMGSVAWGNHPDCPGNAVKAQLQIIVDRAAEINGGDDLDSAHAKMLEDVHYTLTHLAPGSLALALHAAYPDLVADVKAARAAAESNKTQTTAQLSDQQLNTLADLVAAKLTSQVWHVSKG